LLIITFVPKVSLWLPVKTGQLNEVDVEKCQFMEIDKSVNTIK